MTLKTSNILIGQAILYNHLSNDVLKRLEYTDEDINHYLSTGLLGKIDDDNYYIQDEKELIKYYDERVKNDQRFKEDYELRSRVLDMILFAKPNSEYGLNQRYYIALRQNDFATAYECFKLFFEPTDLPLTHLYLLSKVTKIDDDHLELIKDINPRKDLYIQDIHTVDDWKVADTIRDSIVRNDFEKASHVYYEDVLKKKRRQGKEFTRQLLTSLIGRETYYTLFDQYMMRDDYEKGLEYINNGRYLSSGRKIAKKILEFLINKPDNIDIDVFHKDGLWEAIEGNDYIGALFKHLNYVEITGKNDETTRMITTLLKKAVAYLMDVSYEKLDEDVNIYKPIYINMLINQGMEIEDAIEFSKFDDESITYSLIQMALKAIDKDMIDLAKKYMSLCDVNKITNEKDIELYNRVVDSRVLYEDYKNHIPGVKW